MFMIVSVFMSNFIIGASKSIIVSNNISSNVLKLRELEMFLNTEFDKYAFDFKVKSDNKLYYKKIIPVDLTECEIKERELIFSKGTIRLEYDNKNITYLISKINSFRVYARDNLIFLDIKLGGVNLTKIISPMSYDV